MRRSALLFTMFCLAGLCFAGFKPKNIRPKKPDQYQVRTTVAGATYAADLLLDGKAQKDFFYKELTPSHVIAVRLAVFNEGKSEVVLPIDGIQLLGPSGKELAPATAESVAQAVTKGLVVSEAANKEDAPGRVTPNVRTGNPRLDPTDPSYDPRLDPSRPGYDPTDPRYGDPRYSRYPRPGVDVILNPGGRRGGGSDTSQFELQLIEKDFNDKAHSADPIDGMMIRDRFLYFSMRDLPVTEKGFILRIPPSKGIPQEIILKF